MGFVNNKGGKGRHKFDSVYAAFHRAYIFYIVIGSSAFNAILKCTFKMHFEPNEPNLFNLEPRIKTLF